MSLQDIRGYRNNNPGNIRVGAPWHGLIPRARMTPVQSAEAEFCVFEAPAWASAPSPAS